MENNRLMSDLEHAFPYVGNGGVNLVLKLA